MGRIFDALRPHLQDFCEVVDPAELMHQLMPPLGRRDWEEVMAAFESHGRQSANDRLWQRLDGKVQLEHLIEALRLNGNNDLANNIEGTGISATGHVVPLPAQTGTQVTTINNYFTNSGVNMQQGNCNVMEISSATMPESFDSEAQSLESGTAYEVVTEDVQDESPQDFDAEGQSNSNSPGTIPDEREFDHKTVNLLGIVTRSDQCMTNSHQYFDDEDDDETYEKQAVSADSELGTSLKTVYECDETSSVKPTSSQFEYNCRTRCTVFTAAVQSSSETEADVTVNNRGYTGECGLQQMAGISAENVDTVGKSVDVDVSASDDNGSGDDDVIDVGELQADVAARLQLEPVHPMELTTQSIMTKDPCNTSNLLDSNSLTTAEAAFNDELHYDTSLLPDSLSVQRESPQDCDVEGQSDSNPPLDQQTANYRSWVHDVVFSAAEVISRVWRFL